MLCQVIFSEIFHGKNSILENVVVCTQTQILFMNFFQRALVVHLTSLAALPQDQPTK